MNIFSKYPHSVKAIGTICIALVLITPVSALLHNRDANNALRADFEMSIDNYTAEAGDTGVTILVNGSWAESISA